MTKPAILFAISGWDPAPWVDAVRAGDPTRPVYRFARQSRTGRGRLCARVEAGGRGAVRACQPQGDLLARRRSRSPDLPRGLPDVPIVRVVDPDLTGRMAEWVVLQVLIHHRRQRLYDRQQRQRVWRDRRQAAAHEVRVGIMGMGVLGAASARALAALGFRVAGWSRHGASVPGVERYAGAERLDAFLERTDILVCLLPLTAETRGLRAMPLFEKFAHDGRPGMPVVINAGRGGVQVEADIVTALDSGTLGGASLDVFETEPLDAASPLWARDNVVITPHCAAASAADALIPAMFKQISDFEAGPPLTNVVDRKAGY